MREAKHVQVLGTPFSEVVSFGDSLSDNGFINGHGFRRYTNTWTWVEYLSQLLGLHNDNWAFGGAMSDERNQAHPPGVNWSGLAWQVREYLAGVNGADISRVLFTVMGGSNDFWGGQLSGEVSAQNLRLAMDALVAAGARHILFRETSAVLLAPGYLSGAWAGGGAGWKKLVDETNDVTRRIIGRDLPAEHPQVSLHYISTDSLFTKIKNGEPGYRFEILDKFWLGSYDFPHPYKYLWWDEWHPMGTLHLMMAEEALAALRETLALGGAGRLPDGLEGLGAQIPATGEGPLARNG
ncbi:MAG: hypothetical protein LBI99_04515 [Propionibacteriaceae bacterium]|jgi:phospholipase/lecithinase/hemolysin|nr:hypothetical protein [Propionibacteriaceae bacterium]